jgi:hypothetical protein
MRSDGLQARRPQRHGGERSADPGRWLTGTIGETQSACCSRPTACSERQGARAVCQGQAYRHRRPFTETGADRWLCDRAVDGEAVELCRALLKIAGDGESEIWLMHDQPAFAR